MIDMFLALKSIQLQDTDAFCFHFKHLFILEIHGLKLERARESLQKHRSINRTKEKPQVVVLLAQGTR